MEGKMGTGGREGDADCIGEPGISDRPTPTATDSAVSAVQLWAFPSRSIIRKTLLRSREVRPVTVAARTAITSDYSG